MKVDTLSLLIVDENQSMRQLLAALVSERYRSVRAAAPAEIGRLFAPESFDMMLVPRTPANSGADEVDESTVVKGVKGVTAIRSGVTGKIYEFRSINQEASICVADPFERITLQIAIERSELSLSQIKRITEHDAIF